MFVIAFFATQKEHLLRKEMQMTREVVEEVRYRLQEAAWQRLHEIIDNLQIPVYDWDDAVVAVGPRL